MATSRESSVRGSAYSWRRDRASCITGRSIRRQRRSGDLRRRAAWSLFSSSLDPKRGRPREYTWKPDIKRAFLPLEGRGEKDAAWLDGTQGNLRDAMDFFWAAVWSSETYLALKSPRPCMLVGEKRSVGCLWLNQVRCAFPFTLHECAAGPATLGVNLNAVPASYYTSGQTAATAAGTALGAAVTNPFYIGNFSGLTAAQQSYLSTGNNSSFFNSKTTSMAQLLKPYPHLGGLVEIAPVGETKFEQIEASFSRGFTSNFNINVDYQRNFQYDRDWFANTYDQLPSWKDSQTNSRPSRLVGMGTYKLPFGRGQRFLNKSSWENMVVGGWQTDAS